MAKHALQPVHSHYNKMKLIIPLITAGALLSCTAAIAQADTGQHNLQATSVASQQNTVSTDLEPVVASTPEVIAPTTTKLSFERPAVTTTAAPKPVAPVVEASKETPAPDATATPAAPAAAPTVQDVAQAAIASPTNPANIPAAVGAVGAATNGTGATDAFGDAIVRKALSQIGVEQDCTMLVSHSLEAVGLSFHGWPADYLKLGQVTTNPVPGDLIYYKNGGGSEGLAHIAVFIGSYGGKSGMAVHGGWDGHTTKVFSVNVGSGPIYIHVNR